MSKFMSFCAFVACFAASVSFGQGYAPGSTAHMPPQPQMMPFAMPQYQPVVGQSANDSAMLEAVKQGKGFNLRVDLVDPNQQYYAAPQQPIYPYAQQYYCPQPTYQNRYYRDCCGRLWYWNNCYWQPCQ